MRNASFVIVAAESNAERLVIRDVGPWRLHPTVTNSAEQVVDRLRRAGLLADDQQLLYYDSDGVLDEITHDAGRFTGFRFVTPRPAGSF